MQPKKVLYALIGLLEEAGKRMSELSEEIMERGRLLKENGGDPAGRLIDKALGKPRDAAKIAGEILRDAFDNIGLATAGDLENLRDRLAHIEKDLARLKKAEKESAGDKKKPNR
jgi:polyhydroxyalkanoate synthesis regulator phasin